MDARDYKQEEAGGGDERNGFGRNASDHLARQREEVDYWRRRRSRRERNAERGTDRLWGHSPTHNELQKIYEEHDEAARRVEEDARKAEKVERERLREAQKKQQQAMGTRVDASPSPSESSSSSSSSDDDDRRKRKHRKHKRRKKEKKREKKRGKKKQRKRRSSSVESIDKAAPALKIKKEEPMDETLGDDTGGEWVEFTRELREEEAQKAREEEAQMIGPQIPEHILAANKPRPEASGYGADGAKLDNKDFKNMLRGEAAALAAYAREGKRIPRRGEIGLSSDEIATFEQVGYIMSGTRHKSMEATRLRKENQILTAEEKRLLSGFTHEQRKKKEDTIMSQFQSLVSSKRGGGT